MQRDLAEVIRFMAAPVAGSALLHRHTTSAACLTTQTKCAPFPSAMRRIVAALGSDADSSASAHLYLFFFFASATISLEILF